MKNKKETKERLLEEWVYRRSSVRFFNFYLDWSFSENPNYDSITNGNEREENQKPIQCYSNNNIQSNHI